MMVFSDGIGWFSGVILMVFSNGISNTIWMVIFLMVLILMAFSLSSVCFYASMEELLAPCHIISLLILILQYVEGEGPVCGRNRVS